MDGKEDENEGRNTTSSSSSRRTSTPQNKQNGNKRQRRGRPRRPEAKKRPLDTLDARWEDMYDRLVRYRAEHGHCDVPSRPAGGGDLGCWVSRQRSQYRRMLMMTKIAADETTSGRSRPEGRFSRTVPERMERLRALGFRFRRPGGQEDFDDDPGVVGGAGGTGTSISPPPSPTTTTPAVSRTPEVRAEAAAAAFASTSSPGGVGLAFRRALEVRAAAEEAERPIAKRRRVVAATAAPDEASTGQVIKRHPGLITGGHKERWNEMFRRLMSYRAEHGHCDVPISRKGWGDDEDLATLGRWVSNQRAAYKKAFPALTAERIRLLEGQGFMWKIQGCGVHNRRRSTGQGSGAKPTKEGPMKESDSERGQGAVGGNQLEASRAGEDDVEDDDDGEVVSG